MPPKYLRQLRQLLGAERCDTSDAARKHYGKPHHSYHAAAQLPEAICTPETVPEVQEIMRICFAEDVCVVPYGAGTGLEGHTVAPEPEEARGRPCILLSLRRMNRILRLNRADLDVVVEPGLSFVALNRQLAAQDLHFPLDAGPGASLGGMVATNASGTKCCRYGGMKDNVLGLQVVLSDGRLIRTGRRARKTSAGLDLTRLFVGSEGILGVVVEITLRLHPIAPIRRSVLCQFPTVRDAVQTSVGLFVQRGLPLEMCEFMDAPMMRAINLHNPEFNYSELPTLYLEFGGTVQEEVDRLQQVILAVCEKNGSGPVHIAQTKDEQQYLFRARKTALIAAPRLLPGTQVWTTDVAVPLSRIVECLVETQKDIDSSGIIAPIVGHLGDGNFHAFILLRPDVPEDLRRADALNTRLMQRAMAMDGTCTGEHGVGVGKREHLLAELGSETIDVMRSVKRALDPKLIMNPGKQFRTTAPASPELRSLL